MKRWERLVYVLSLVLVIAASVGYTTYVARQFCSLVVTMDDAYSDPDLAPPATEIGQKLARDVRKLRGDLHC